MGVFVFVWGTRTKEKLTGTAAIDCPGCAKRVIADIFDVYKARHVYFIRGKYKKADCYARCRFCGIASELPPGIAIKSPAPSNNNVFPNQSFIEETNPSLSNEPSTIPPLDYPLPKGVSREQWALCGAILQNIENESKSSKAAGNAEGLFILIGLAGLASSMFVYERYAHAPLLPLIALCLSVIILIYLIYKLQNTLIFRAVHKVMRVYVQRFTRTNRENHRGLIESSKLLGRSFKKANQYLKYALNKF